ncbi:MAG: acyloxyacyl hydrolase [bacterium]
MRFCKKIFVAWFAVVFLAGGGVWHTAQAEETNSVAASKAKVWYGAYVSGGSTKRLWSVKEYTGYKPGRVGLFREAEIGDGTHPGIPWRWSVRYELMCERLSGTVELVEDQVPPDERTGGPYMKSLNGLWQLAGLWVPRVVFFPNSPVRPSLHAGIGLSVMNEKILEEGTYYNFNFVGGGGVEADISKLWSVFVDCRLEHYSNGGAMSLTDKAVIGLESISCVLGVRREF